MKIRPIRQQVDPTIAPTVRAPLGITSGFARGLGELGAAGGEVARTIHAIALRKKYFDDSVSLTNLTNDAKIALEEHRQLIQLTEYGKIPDARKDGLARINQDLADKASKINPQVAANWKSIWNTLSADSEIETGRIETEKFRQNTIAGLHQFLDLVKDQAVTAIIQGDAEKLGILYQSADDAIDNVRQNFKVTGTQAEGWKEKLRNEIDNQIMIAINAEKRQQQEADKQAEKEKKDELERNFGIMVNMYSQGTLTEEYIRGSIKLRNIDPDKGLAMINRLRSEARLAKEDVENNPVIVGSLASDIELGLDVSDRMDQALMTGNIKSGTYINLKAKLGDREFKRGLYYINRALQPSPADKWTPDTHVRFAEAIDDYQSRVAQGQNPIEVAREIVNLNIGHIRRTISGLRTPRFLAGEKTSILDLALAKTITIGKYEAGAITIEEFNREAKLIKQLESLLNQLSDREGINTDMSDRVKQSKTLRKK